MPVTFFDPVALQLIAAGSPPAARRASGRPEDVEKSPKAAKRS
jgi:hypothetical protein